MARGRKPLVDQPSILNLSLAGSLRGQIDIMLYSEVEERVPKGAYQRFFTTLALEYFNSTVLDLAPFIGSQPGTMLVRGSQQAIEALKAKLEGAV